MSYLDDANLVMAAIAIAPRLDFESPTLRVLESTYLFLLFFSTTPAFFLASAKASGVCVSPSFLSAWYRASLSVLGTSLPALPELPQPVRKMAFPRTRHARLRKTMDGRSLRKATLPLRFELDVALRSVPSHVL